MRLFIAINLPSELRRTLFTCTEPLRAALGATVAWVPAEKLHVTVQFIGSRPPDDAPAFERVLRDALGTTRATCIDIRGIGAFPALSRARVLWIGVAANPMLRTLYQVVTAATAALGVAAESRGYHPHVTLGRVRANQSIDASKLATLAAQVRCAGTADVRSVDLMESVSGPAGARYALLAAVPLLIPLEEG